MISCPNCSSHQIQSRGTKITKLGEVRRRYRCMNRECRKKWFSRPDSKSKFEPEKVVEFSGFNKFVITSVQNHCAVNHEFLSALRNYCEINKAKLLLIPFKYRIPGDEREMQDRYEIPEEDLFRSSVRLHPKLRLLGDININPTIDNPLSGMDPLSKGDSLIIAHAQLQMRTLPMTVIGTPTILTTTGAVTIPRYSQTKTGYRGKFNHSFSAVVIELEDDVFHYRVLNADDSNGFFDVSGYYGPSHHEPKVDVEALITGDEHAQFFDSQVLSATYTDEKSIVNVLKPKKLVRGDVLDFFSGSHHHQKSYLTRYAKHYMGTDDIEEELRLTIKHIADTTPAWSENVIVQSNHNEHIDRWLDSMDPKQDFRNAKLYHRLMYLMLDNMKPMGKMFRYPSAFKLWVQNTKHDHQLPKITWLGRDETYKICGIELSLHGDVGANGSRASAQQFSRMAEKLVVGHSHSPSITRGCYTVGTSTGKLEYTKGPSSWANCHCVIYANGRRQMIFIVNGKWRCV